MNRVDLININSVLDSSNYVFIFGLGFDPRSLSILKNIQLEKIESIVGISNAGWSSFNEPAILEYKSFIRKGDLIVGEGAQSILDVADSFIAGAIPRLIEHEKILIDISSLSHELLVVIMGILNNFDLLKKCTLLYIGASEYSINTSKENIWLSRGVKTIRSAFGFPGVMLPSRKLHLIILAGFEVERASEVIIRYEPSSLSIGLGEKAASFSHEHFENNLKFHSNLENFIIDQISSDPILNKFYFSCVSPIETKNKIIEHIDMLRLGGEKNIVICPLNTKISTVGVVLAAIERPDIQICYAEPEEYNIQGYCKAGDFVSIFKF